MQTIEIHSFFALLNLCPSQPCLHNCARCLELDNSFLPKSILRSAAGTAPSVGACHPCKGQRNAGCGCGYFIQCLQELKAGLETVNKAGLSCWLAQIVDMCFAKTGRLRWISHAGLETFHLGLAVHGSINTDNGRKGTADSLLGLLSSFLYTCTKFTRLLINKAAN